MDALYHYCTTEAFHAIISSRSIRLSSLSLSNDSLEGKLVASAIDRLAQRDGLSMDKRERLKGYLDLADQVFDGLGFCLSEDGDVLSQWRGYAGDGAGVAIGFSRSYLEALSGYSKSKEVPGFVLEQVKYHNEEHDREVQPTYAKIKELIDAGALNPLGVLSLLKSEEEIANDKETAQQLRQQLTFTVMALLPKLYLLKSHAFQEEMEWRLLSLFVFGGEEESTFRALPDRISPFRQYELIDLNDQPIVEVVMGPKHISSARGVETFLANHGFRVAHVRRSAASYR